MLANLLAGLSEDERKIVQHEWDHSKNLRDLLRKHLTKQLNCGIIEEEEETIYLSPDVAVRLAFNGGKRSGLRQAVSILT